jgi:hypothetical protein
MMAWTKFANSVKFRLGMRLADVNSSKSVSVVNSALNAGVFTSNADNASMAYQSAAPNTNPVYSALVLSGRSDYVISNVLADKLNSTMDGRLFRYASGPIDFPFPTDDNDVTQDTTFTTDGLFLIIDGETTHVSGEVTLTADQEGSVSYIQGGVYGTNNSFNAFSKVSALLYDDPEYPGTILNYAELEFLMAEAVERGGYSVTGTAEEHYNAGIQASFDQWGASGYVDYIAQPEIAYATASGDYKQKIGFQMWVALYNQGFESWNTWKRLDFDGLVPLPGETDLSIPLRLPYPLEEAQLNGQNLSAAASAIGGDEVTTKIFWDMN